MMPREEGLDVTQALQSTNLADMIDEESLKTIGHELLRAIKADDESRAEWLEKNEDSLNLALQVMDTKNFPWNNSSNVKYPLLTVSTLQFHARAQETLLRGSDLVLAKAMPTATADPEAEARRARVSKYMSYQYLHMMPTWAEDMDRLLFVLPMIGMAFTKTRNSAMYRGNLTSLVLPKDLILNYRAKDFASARKTEIISYSTNQMYSLIRSGYFSDVEWNSDVVTTSDRDSTAGTDSRIGVNPSQVDEFVECYESHTFLDLDGDGYKEPYIVWLSAQGTVFRIQPRWAEGGVNAREDGEIIDITPLEEFTRYIFLPDPESPLYGIGLGTILGPLNHGVNTLINQLIDAGTLAVMPSGFLGRGVRSLRGGEIKFNPGEWKNIASTGDDIRKGIFPLPAKDPSPVLFQLLGMLVDSGRQVGSIADMITGENPGQNQPLATSQMVLEQGLKVFSGIYKRIYRSLSEDYKKLYKFNFLYMDEGQYREILEDPKATKADFDGSDYDILPNADPDILSEYQRMFKSQSLLEKLKMGLPLNLQVVTKRVLEAEQHENIQELMTVQPPPPPPDIAIKQQELEMRNAHKQADLQIAMLKHKTDQLKAWAAAMKNIAEAEATEAGTQLENYKAMTEAMLKQQDFQQQEADRIVELLKVNNDKEKNEQSRQTPTDGGAPSGS